MQLIVGILLCNEVLLPQGEKSIAATLNQVLNKIINAQAYKYSIGRHEEFSEG